MISAMVPSTGPITATTNHTRCDTSAQPVARSDAADGRRSAATVPGTNASSSQALTIPDATTGSSIR